MKQSVLGVAFMIGVAAISAAVSDVPWGEAVERVKPAVQQVTEALAAKIKEGMTPKEVEAVLGRPPDERGSRFTMVADGGCKGCIQTDHCTWRGQRGCVEVVYHDGGRVAYVSYKPKK